MPSSKILITKLQRPRDAAGTIARPRLHDLLDRGQKQSCTLISAPAGYGKSTLVSSWIECCQYPGIWVSLDEKDSELHTFFCYLLAALQQTFPKISLQTESLLAAPNLPDAVELSRNLINDLSQIQEPFVVVLDDYHRVCNGPVNEVVAELLMHSHANMHLILVTRQDPQLPVASLRANGRITEIRATDLRFSSGEIRAFMEKMLKVAPDDATLAMLDRKIEGWPAGLRLSCLYLQDKRDVKRYVDKIKGNLTHVAEYLAAEVFAKLQPEQMDFLLRTSIVDRFCMPLYLAILDPNTGCQEDMPFHHHSQLKTWLVNSDLFLIPLDDEGYWYRYHHLFQQLLQAHLSDVFTAEQVVEFHRRASGWFARNSWIDESIHHALLAVDARLAARLILKNRYTLMDYSQFLRLRRWLKNLPDDILAEYPLFFSTQAYLAIEFGQDHQVYANLALAEQALEEPATPEDRATLKAEVGILKSFIDMAVGDAPKALARIEESIELLPRQAFMIRSMAILTLAGCYQMTGQIELAVKTVKRALQETAWPENLKARLHFYLTIVWWMNADLHGAMAASHDCMQTLTKPNAHTLTFAYCQLGTAHYYRNELEQAESFMNRILAMYEVSNPSYAANAGFILACIYTMRDEHEEADTLLARLTEHFRENNFLTILEMVKAWQIELAIRRGQIQKASQQCGTVDFNMRPPLWFFYVSQFTPIKLFLVEGGEKNLLKASRQLADLEMFLDRSNRRNVQIDLLAIKSIVCMHLGEEKDALDQLRAALDIAKPGGWIRNFVDLGQPMAYLLVRFTRAEPTHAFAQKILSALKKDVDYCEGTPLASVQQHSLEQALISKLTKREIELLYWVAEGLSNKEIADKHNIGAETVKTHLRNIYKKINVNSRLAAIKKAHAMGIISIN